MKCGMKERLLAVVVLALAAACNQTDDLKDAANAGKYPLVAKNGLRRLAETNATVVGVLNDVQPPYIYASFRDGKLEWSTDPQRRSMIQGQADVYSRPEMTCLGFEYARLSTPGRAERYLVCEALAPLHVTNALPRSQQFTFPVGALFLQYEPPKGAGFPQYYYLSFPK
jgi:hypothetical protein